MSARCQKKQPRGRFHRAFVNWLDKNERRLAVPLTPVRRTQKGLVYRFEGLTPKLEIFIGSDIGIYVTHEEQCWDALLFFEGDPQKTSHGYICSLCKPEFQQPYPSREELWIDHVFEPFATWTHEKLYPAKWLMLGQTQCGGATWAELHGEKKIDSGEARMYWIPLRTGAAGMARHESRPMDEKYAP